ncbi:MAG TPA: DUF3040 domain-containing protein [Nocardioidaceae bacterium]|nr:DUF3040 domain-containing protein [Nocardioidaceae bacterium]
MPLSEEELRLLEQMERALVAEDPKLASTMRGTRMRATARRRAMLAGGVFVVGVAVLMGGAVTQVIPLGILGFVVMLVSAYFALSSWRGQNHVAEQPGASPAASPGSFSVLDGGRRTKRRSGRPSRGRGGSSGSMMQRFEERWRRRRDQNGF